MRTFRFYYKDLKFEVESAGVLFAFAFAFSTTGLGLLSENIWFYFLDLAAEEILKKEKSYSNEIIGAVLVLIGLFFLLVYFRNWRVNIYDEIYAKVNATVHEFYTTLYLRQGSFDRVAWQTQHDKVYALYYDGTKYIDQHKIKVSQKIADEARSILYACAQELTYFQGTIEKTEKLLAGTLTFHYDPIEDYRLSKEKGDKLRTASLNLRRNSERSFSGKSVNLTRRESLYL